AGAKGIGRFALDKLGGKCEMTTIFNPEYHKADTDSNGKKTDFTGYEWTVNWEDFEGEFKTIDNVDADLIGIRPTSLKEELRKIVPQLNLSDINAEHDFQYGTVLKISNLRDNWEDYFVEQVYADLEVLVPPKESGGFEIYLYSSLNPGKYGEVISSICDDYDYKIHAVADENQNVKIKIYRKEYDVDLIDRDFFNRDSMKNYPYTRSVFVDGEWELDTTFSKLIPGFSAQDNDNVFADIGIFDFTFYFLKRAYSTPD